VAKKSRRQRVPGQSRSIDPRQAHLLGNQNEPKPLSAADVQNVFKLAELGQLTPNHLKQLSPSHIIQLLQAKQSEQVMKARVENLTCQIYANDGGILDRTDEEDAKYSERLAGRAIDRSLTLARQLWGIEATRTPNASRPQKASKPPSLLEDDNDDSSADDQESSS